MGSDRWQRLRARLDRRTILIATLFLIPAAAALTLLGVTTEDVTQHNGLSTSDPAHLRFFVDHRTDALVQVAKDVTNLGAAPILAVLALLSAAVLWWRGQRVAVSIAPGAALGVAACVAAVGKQAVGRVRPPVGIRLLAETEPSFPSGHATDSAAFFVALGLVLAMFVFRRPLARAAALVAGALTTLVIGLTRLVLGVHWPTDVLAGWSIGVLVALVVTVTVAGVSRWTHESPSGSSLVRVRLLAVLQSSRPVGLRPSQERAAPIS
ncbi:MAG TPA: phosphatase PAP2 family protein [Acidimicrobiales bacterium]|nr:phosphatase PAP2 family protein [Acidimicrobiales bacterium]